MLFWKQIGLALQIAIVVAAVLLFSFFDPFGWLKSKKLNLEHTPINVNSIRAIGQLYTAEYYGEVLNSLQDSRIQLVMEENVNLEQEYKDLHSQFQSSIMILIEEKSAINLRGLGKRRKLYDYFYHRFNDLTENPYYQDYLAGIMNILEYKKEKKFLKDLYDEIEVKSKLLAINETTLKTQIIEEIHNERLNELTANKKFKRRQIVVLGRGWVKAGIDFGKFTQQNFRYDVNKRTIHLIGIKPEILSHDINPWFIPEKKVKGFEVILVNQKAKKPQYMQIVKEATLEKLKTKALAAGILDKAKLNAERNLKDFFSLLLEDGVDQVLIHDNFFSYFELSLKAGMLSPDDMKIIDSLFVKRFDTDSSEVISMRDSLKSYRKIKVLNKTYNVQRFSSLLSFVEDEELSAGELSSLRNMQKQMREDMMLLDDLNAISGKRLNLNLYDTIWYYPSAETRKTYFKNINIEPRIELSPVDVMFKSAEYRRWDSIRNEGYRRKIYEHMLTGKKSDYEQIVEQIREIASQVIVGDTSYVSDSEDIVIDASEGQNLLSGSNIAKVINEKLLEDGGVPIDSLWVYNIEETLLGCLRADNLDSFQIKRTSVIDKYFVCDEDDCESINVYASMQHFKSHPSDTSKMKKVIFQIDSVDLPENWENANLDIVERLLINRISAKDSVWYFPSKLELEKISEEWETRFPKSKFSGFWRGIFASDDRKMKYKEARLLYLYQLVNKEIIKNKLQFIKTKKLFIELDV